MNSSLTKEQRDKISKVFESIIELYMQRKSQKEIAEKFQISVSQVAEVTRSMGIYHTVKSRPSDAIVFLDDFSYLFDASVE